MASDAHTTGLLRFHRRSAPVDFRSVVSRLSRSTCWRFAISRPPARSSKDDPRSTPDLAPGVEVEVTLSAAAASSAPRPLRAVSESPSSPKPSRIESCSRTEVKSRSLRDLIRSVRISTRIRRGAIVRSNLALFRNHTHVPFARSRSWRRCKVMVTRVPAARARQQLSELIARVTRGERVQITRFGRPLATPPPVRRRADANGTGADESSPSAAELLNEGRR